MQPSVFMIFSMRKIFALLVLLLMSLNSFAQDSGSFMTAKTTKKVAGIPENTLLSINGISYRLDPINSTLVWNINTAEYGTLTLESFNNKQLPFVFYVDDIQGYWDRLIIKEVIPEYQNAAKLYADPYQYELRRELESEALQFVAWIRDNGMELNDPYLENYLYSLVAKISPKYLLDARTTNVNVIIIQDPSPSASCYPNGTLVINSGLLATIHSEDELVAVLSHEIAHYVLDHHVRNINEIEKNRRRSQIFAGIATLATAVIEGVAAANGNNYMPGVATSAVAMMSSAAVTSVCEDLGMEYNHEQEYQADRVAFEILSILGYKQEAMATALSRIEHDFTAYKGASMYVSSDTHPSLNSRIKRLGVPNLDRDVEFEQIVSFAVSNAAMLRYGQGRFTQSLSIIDQNIENGVATANDYVLKAKCLLALENSQDAVNEILALLEIAKHIDSSNLDIYKTEILAILRGGQMDVAIEKLTDYMLMLSEVSAMNSLTMLFVEQEIEWSKYMLIKLNAMS